MKRALLAVLVSMTAAAGVATPAAAQRIDSPYRFLEHSQFAGPYLGRMMPAQGRLGLGPHDAMTLGARWAIQVSGPFLLGAEIGYAPTRRTVRDTVFIAADSVFREIGEADMRLLSVLGNVRLNLTGPRTWHGLQPFLLTGVGVVIDVAGSPAVEEDMPANLQYDYGTTFAAQVAAGVDWFATQRVSLRLEGRNMLWKLGIPEGFLLTEAGALLPRSDWENNFVVSAGISFHF
jgi:hypothetical protein